jgi:hypothetical protein
MRSFPGQLCVKIKAMGPVKGSGRNTRVLDPASRCPETETSSTAFHFSTPSPTPPSENHWGPYYLQSIRVEPLFLLVPGFWNQLCWKTYCHSLDGHDGVSYLVQPIQ